MTGMAYGLGWLMGNLPVLIVVGAVLGLPALWVGIEIREAWRGRK